VDQAPVGAGDVVVVVVDGSPDGLPTIVLRVSSKICMASIMAPVPSPSDDGFDDAEKRQPVPTHRLLISP